MRAIRFSLIFLISFHVLGTSNSGSSFPNPRAEWTLYMAGVTFLAYVVTMIPAAILSAEVKGDICPVSKGIASQAGCDLLDETMMLGASSVAPVAGATILGLTAAGIALAVGAEENNPVHRTVPAVLMGLGSLGSVVMALVTDFKYLLKKKEDLPSNSTLVAFNRIESQKHIEDVDVLTMANAGINLVPYGFSIVMAPLIYFYSAKNTRPACCGTKTDV